MAPASAPISFLEKMRTLGLTQRLPPHAFLFARFATFISLHSPRGWSYDAPRTAALGLIDSGARPGRLAPSSPGTSWVLLRLADSLGEPREQHLQSADALFSFFCSRSVTLNEVDFFFSSFFFNSFDKCRLSRVIRLLLKGPFFF